MSGRPQPLQDIEERIQLLKMTLGLFPPGEPEPIARELCELGEDILAHRLLAGGAAPAAKWSLAELADEAVRRDGGVAAVLDLCREMLRLQALIADAPGESETASHLVALATAAGELLAVTRRPA